MENIDKQKWNAIYASSEKIFSPCQAILNYQHLLPARGNALDLACGRGENAMFLARKGLSVTAYDISSNVTAKLIQTAREKKLKILVEERDIVVNPPKIESFDVIVVSHFLDRNLIPHIRYAIKPGGMIFYQTFIKDKSDNIGPSNPDFLLKQNELLSLFHNWYILLYREEGLVGDIKQGFRNQAMLIARKP